MPQQPAIRPSGAIATSNIPPLGEEARLEVHEVGIGAGRLGREAVFGEHAEDELARRVGVRADGTADGRALEARRGPGGADSRPVRRCANARAAALSGAGLQRHRVDRRELVLPRQGGHERHAGRGHDLGGLRAADGAPAGLGEGAHRRHAVRMRAKARGDLARDAEGRDHLGEVDARRGLLRIGEVDRVGGEQGLAQRGRRGDVGLRVARPHGHRGAHGAEVRAEVEARRDCAR